MPAALPSLFVTGTDTGVGKTGVTAAIVRTLRRAGESVGALKPACSGVEPDGTWGDIEVLVKAVCGPRDNAAALRPLVGPHCFDAPLAPPQAARLAGRSLSVDDFDRGRATWGGRCGRLVVEGVGGLLCPLTDDTVVADLIARWQMPCVAVVGLKLGAINHALLTAEVAAARGLDLRGWIMNELTPADTPHAAELVAVAAEDIAARSGRRILAWRSFGSDTLHASLPTKDAAQRDESPRSALQPGRPGGTIDAATIRGWF